MLPVGAIHELPLLSNSALSQDLNQFIICRLMLLVSLLVFWREIQYQIVLTGMFLFL